MFNASNGYYHIIPLVYVEVADPNLFSPTFNNVAYSGSIKTFSPIGTFIVMVTAFDRDIVTAAGSTLNSNVRY